MIIGIIGRPKVMNNREMIVAYKRLCDRLYDYGVLPICLIPSIRDNDDFNDVDIQRIKKEISICDGIILQGGEYFNDYDIEIVKYLYKENIPTLGICLGMQEMGKAFDGLVNNDAKHNISKNYVHYVKLDNKSKLFDILGENIIFVNSLHHDRVVKTALSVSGDFDGIIEALEDKNKKFFIGVQWHPEFLNDITSDRIFMAFIDACKKA